MGIELGEARAPDGLRIYAIGDVHGYADLLRAMHRRIDEDLRFRPAKDWRIVHVGDYVDRGPDSKGVLDFLIGRMAQDARIIALRGNHDQAMLDFLSEPDPASMFATNGGEETARSYGVTLATDGDDVFLASADQFINALPSMHRRFLEQRPYSVSFGDFFFCHAGIQPMVPLEAQTPDTLMWIRREFLTYEGLHPKIVVHGHTPQEEADLRPNRINIDTGVYVREKLTALILEGDAKSIYTVHRAKGEPGG
jgi:serine/threonine protein phosphatase 1